MDSAGATKKEVVEFKEEAGAELEMGPTSLHQDVLLDPEKNVASERTYDDHSLVGSYKVTLDGPVAQQISHQVDATEGRNRGAQRTLWEILHTREKDQGIVHLVLDLT